jgi:hypothetical protein
MKSILKIAFPLFLLLLSGCSRNVTPHQASSKGGLKCGKYHLK